MAGLAAMSAPSTHAVRRVVLISDGLATVGTTSREMLGVLGERAADHGVQITSIGVGLDYDEQTLNALALRSSGRLFHLERPDQLASIMSEEMSLLQATRATNALVEIVPAPGVELVTAEGARSTMDNGAIKVPLGAMFAGQHKEFLVRARVNLGGEGTQPIASVRLLFQDPAEGNLQRVQEAVARVDAVTDPAVAARRTNSKAQGVLAMIEASKATERAVAQIGNDDFATADRELAEAEQKLVAQAAAASTAADKQRFQSSARRVADARAGAGKAMAAPMAARPAAKRAIQLDANEASMNMMGF
jgi:Ca-activated chloride channel family protein